MRRGLGLSQGAFGEAAGFSRNTVVTCEHGRTPCRALLDRIARAGGVTADWLLHGTASERAPSVRRDQAWQEAVALRQVWQGPNRRDAVVGVLKALRSSP